MKNDKAHSNEDYLRVSDEDVQKAIDWFENVWSHPEWGSVQIDWVAFELALQALKAYRPSGQSTEDTAGEGSPVVREKRTSN